MLSKKYTYSYKKNWILKENKTIIKISLSPPPQAEIWSESMPNIKLPKRKEKRDKFLFSEKINLKSERNWKKI